MEYGKISINKGSVAQFSLEIVVRSYSWLTNDRTNPLFEGSRVTLKENKQTLNFLNEKGM